MTGGGAFAFPVRFAGVQYGTNFGTDPAFVPFPLPTIGGLARQELAVDLLINDLERVKSNVPAGPFSISNLPVLTGSGEVQLRVTDLLGRQQVVTQLSGCETSLARSITSMALGRTHGSDGGR